MKRGVTSIVLLWISLATVGLAEMNLISNGKFEEGLRGWWLTPANGKDARIIPGDTGMGNILQINATDNNFGVNSARLTIGKDIFPNKSYKASCRIRPSRIESGTFSASLTFYRADSNYAGQSFLCRYEPGEGTDKWKTVELFLGQGTRIEFPADATALSIRFSFWDKTGKCQGSVNVDDVSLTELTTPFSPLNAADTNIVRLANFRQEQLQGKSYYWIEAEDLVPAGTCRGSWNCQRSWSKGKNAMPNESGGASLIRPEWKNIANVAMSMPVKNPGKYNLFVRIGTFRLWGTQAISGTANQQPFKVALEARDQLLNDAFTWAKINAEPMDLKDCLDLKFRNEMPGNFTAVDCFLLTDDLNYVPPRPLPTRQYFSALPDSGPAIEADFWHPAMLNSPVYLCRNSHQQFLIRLRNYTGHPQKDFALEITLPDKVFLVNPVRSQRWQGNDGKWKQPHFINMSPDRIESEHVEKNGLAYNRYRLFFDRPVDPYDINQKTAALFFLVFGTENIAPGSYEVTLETQGLKNSWQGKQSTQTLQILPELNAPASPGYEWGVDAIYASMLSHVEQRNLLNTFEKAGVTVWASRVRESDPDLSLRNQEHWKLVREKARLKLANWGEFWWPGTPYTDESLDYVRQHPETLGVWRNDDRGKSLQHKLICPETLLDSEDTFINHHMEKFTTLLKKFGITEVMEDAEYSSPLSYCFCERCKKKFAAFSGIAFQELQSLTGDELLGKYQEKWVDFRCRQNAMILDKISKTARRMYPEIKYKLFCGYPSTWVKNRYGVDWRKLIKLPEINGVYVGGGVPGTAAQIEEMNTMCAENRKEFISMANATLSFPSGFDETSSHSQKYLEARIIHDIMSGSRGIFIWWWGTLDGRCMKAYETGAKIAATYGDILLNGHRTFRKIGQNDDFYLLTAENQRGKLIALTNPSRFVEDRVFDVEAVMAFFSAGQPPLNVLSGEKESLDDVRKKVSTVFRCGDVILWYIPNK